MRKIFLFIISAVLLASCAKEYEEVIEDSWEDGTPKTVKVYEKDGDKRILVKEKAFYENGQQRLEGEFKEGERHGYWQYWYENGNKWSEGYFKQGRRDGLGKTYHDNGQLYVEGTYDEDVRVDVWRFYGKDGELLKEIDYNK